jgi:hypothetical protein
MIDPANQDLSPPIKHRQPGTTVEWRGHLTRAIDWARRVDFLVQKWPYVAALVSAAVGLGVNLTSTIGIFSQQAPIIGSFLSSIGAGSIVLVIGLALRGERQTKGLPPYDPASPPPITSPTPSGDWAQRADRLIRLADLQRN